MAVSSKNEEAQPASGERITVALIAKTAKELRRIQASTGLSKTDAVNRAISVYDFVVKQLDAENELIVRDPETGVERLVHIT